MSDKLWTLTVRCRDCNAILNTATGVPKAKKLMVATSAPLVVGKCPGGCRSTFEDCNMNIKLDWEAQ